MAFVESVTDSGLVVREQGADGAAIARALKQHDPSLRLVPQSARDGRIRWEVRKFMGGDRPSLFLLAWQTVSGEPLPLSWRLLDLVKQHDLNVTRSTAPDPDVANAELRERRRNDFDSAADAIADDHRPYIDRGRVQIRVKKQVL